MRVLTAYISHKEVGWRFAFALTHVRNLLTFGSASRALGTKASASEGQASRQKEGEGGSSDGRVSYSTKYSRDYVRGDEHQFTAQQQQPGRHELVSAKTVDWLLALAEERRWQPLVMILTDSPEKQSTGTMSNCFIWLGRNGKQKASLELFRLLKKAGESEQILSRYVQFFISSFAARYGAEQALILLKTIEEKVQVRPNVSLFEVLISGFCRQGQQSQAVDILDEMQLRSLTLTSSCFNPLLKSFSDHLMLDEAFETLAAMKRLGVATSLANYNILIGGCARAGDMEKAYGVLSELQQQGIQPNTPSFNHIMEGFGRQKRLKRALSVFREMEYIGLKPNKDTYLVLLRACGTNGDLSEAMKLFKKAQELGLSTSETLLSAMIQVYVDNAQFDSALKLIRKLELKGTSIGVKASSQLQRGLALAGRLEEALKVYEERQQSGKHPSPESVATLLVALGKVGRMDTMLKIFEELNCSDSWSEYPMAYRTNYLNIFCIHICLGYIRHKQPEGAVKFLQHISKLGMANNRTFYEKIFLQIASPGSEEQEMNTIEAADSLALLRALKSHGIQLSRMAHETLLDHCASLGRSKEAWEIVEEMERESLPLNVMSKVRLFRVFVAAREEHDAEKVLETISKFDLLDREVRLLLEKIVQLELERCGAGSSRDANSFRRLLAVQKQLKDHIRLRKGNHCMNQGSVS